MNITCNKVGCDHNTGFTKECMFGVDEKLVETAKDTDNSMCEVLRTEILKKVGNNNE